jgi:hypothetical protein
MYTTDLPAIDTKITIENDPLILFNFINKYALPQSQ